MKILILCTGNSCRSQMAHGFLQSFDKNIQVYSAGTHPAKKVNTLAVETMAEVGIDISKHIPAHVTTYLTAIELMSFCLVYSRLLHYAIIKWITKTELIGAPKNPLNLERRQWKTLSSFQT